MTLQIRPGFAYDTDASNYIDAVEAADQADTPGIGAMETAVRYAINDFVIGCKQDNIWSAIQNSCILAGAKTLEGAFIDLKSCTKIITNYNNLFADGTYSGSNYTTGDYNRKTGLAGNGSKYLITNRQSSADGKNDHHAYTFATTKATIDGAYIGINTGNSADKHLEVYGSNIYSRNLNSVAKLWGAINLFGNGGYGMGRSNPSNYVVLLGTSFVGTESATSNPPNSSIMQVFAKAGIASNPRLAFYSLGSYLGLPTLDARVSALITAIGAAIP